jgi:hypothetical protein
MATNKQILESYGEVSFFSGPHYRVRGMVTGTSGNAVDYGYGVDKKEALHEIILNLKATMADVVDMITPDGCPCLFDMYKRPDRF